ncbi:hypothetical protein BJ170DRAFT_692364 [Xylariales sp. AK1849]|nr:hypothetical protein BJ170DRAFT_692364 [Xylariales sp. AK1849]
MDDGRLSTSTTSNRSSALPRPTSRLPQPRTLGIPSSASTIRHAASTEGLRGRLSQSASNNDLRAAKPAHNKLRTTASRDQLDVSSSALRKPQRPIAPPLSSQAAIRGARSRDSLVAKDEQFKRPLVPKKRPSTQFAPASFLAQAESPLEEEDEEGDEEEKEIKENTLPPLSNYTEDGLTFDTARSHSSKPSPSLAERTMETLSRLPSSPAFKRRGSNFFDPEASSMRPSSQGGSGGSRPGSSYQSDGSTARSLSRPGSSSGPSEGLYSNFRASTNTFKPPLATLHGTPTRRAPVTAKTPNFKPSSSASKSQLNPSLSASAGPRVPSPEKISVSKFGSKMAAARPLKPRASLNGLFKKPSLSSLDNAGSATSELTIRPPRKVSVASIKSTATTSGEDRNLSSASTTSTALTVDSVEETLAASTARKSSAALRDQIAKAKAAKRAASRQLEASSAPTPLRSPLIPTDNTFDFGLSDDPFGQKQFEDSNRKVMQSRIDMARTTGRLNISAMGLKQIPDEIRKMYDLEAIGRPDGAWAESIDLTRFVAADNELETIDDSIFPDTDPIDFADEEDGRGHQFGGLESLDLHGNTLIALPMGLRRLHELTSLNLAQNKLANGCLDVISQILPLRDLKLGGNLLYGKMDSCFAALENLEILDLRGNEISALPDGFEKLSRLRILNVNDNALVSLPFGTLANMPLTELLAHRNKLTGTLIDPEVDSLPQLQTLDVSANQLSFLATAALSLPSLLQLTISMNRIQALPDMSTWRSLLTLTADENSIAAIPDGFTSLNNMRHADLTSNDIRIIPPEIARMDSLALLRISGNPLRDKKFTSLTTEELKDSLAARLEPLPGHEGGLEQFGNGFDPSGGRSLANSQPSNAVDSATREYDEYDDNRSDNDNFATPPTSAPHSPVRARSQTVNSLTWPIKPGGILDRANTQSSSLHPVVCSKIAASQSIREVRLQHNTLTNLPTSLSFFADTLTSLSISHNQLVGESYLTEELDLTALKELNISHNHITSLGPLCAFLRAPNLQKIDISCNRIVSLPVMRDVFPSLSVLLAANNHLEDLAPDSISGLKTVDASNNDIAHLNPRLGLLGGAGNLERLEVTGNRFRVPRWNVLDRGTQATLRWLRGRVPVAEMTEWKTKAGNADDDGSFTD